MLHWQSIILAKLRNIIFIFFKTFYCSKKQSIIFFFYETKQFRDNNEWTGPDSCWYQTYRAMGTSITGISFVTAGDETKSANIMVLKDNNMTSPGIFVFFDMCFVYI